MTNFKRILSALAIVLLAQFAQAGAVYTNARAAIGTGYTVDWSSLGAEFTAVAPPATLSGVTLSGASTFTVFSGSTFSADFFATDTVLSLFDMNAGEIGGEFDLVFASAVRSVGAQVQSYLYNSSFAGLISAFDSANSLIGSYSVSGANSGNGDGSAVFAGIVSDSLNIRRVVFSGFGDGAGINQLSVGDTLGGGNQTVPEPEGILLGLTALMALAIARRRRV